MKTRDPTEEEKKSIGKKVTSIVDSIFNTFIKADLNDDIVLNVCLAMIHRVIKTEVISKKSMIKIIESMYEEL